jgi:hypothetical protein
LSKNHSHDGPGSMGTLTGILRVSFVTRMDEVLTPSFSFGPLSEPPDHRPENHFINHSGLGGNDTGPCIAFSELASPESFGTEGSDPSS